MNAAGESVALSAPKQWLKLTGAAILVLRDIKHF